MANITQSFYSQLYKDAILSQDPNQINTFEEGQDNYFIQQAIGLAMSIVASETLGLQDNIFPASANSTYLDKHLAVANLPPRLGTTPSIGTLAIVIPLTPSGNVVVTSDFVIPINTLMINNLTGYSYITSIINTIKAGTYNSTNNTINIGFVSNQNGLNTSSPIGSINTFNTPLNIITNTGVVPIASGNIINIIPGNTGQTDYDISYLVNKNSRLPKGSGTAGDYFTWVIQSTPNITDAEIIPSSIISGYNNYFYVAVISGLRDPNFNITLTYPINRTTNQSDIITCRNYLETKRNILDNYNVISVDTYLIDNGITKNTLRPQIILNIFLASGLSKDSFITSSNGINQTVDAWIRQQFRFCILSAPYFGDKIDNTTNRYIKNDTIITLLKSLLGNDSLNSGSIASIISFVSFYYTDINNPNIPNIPVPSNTSLYNANTGNILIIYDIDISPETLVINYNSSMVSQRFII